MNADEENWYYSTRIDLIEPVAPFDADDWLYENKYYNRTGIIPRVAYSEAYKIHKLEMKSFGEVIEELAEILFQN